MSQRSRVGTPTTKPDGSGEYYPHDCRNTILASQRAQIEQLNRIMDLQGQAQQSRDNDKTIEERLDRIDKKMDILLRKVVVLEQCMTQRGLGTHSEIDTSTDSDPFQPPYQQHRNQHQYMYTTPRLGQMSFPLTRSTGNEGPIVRENNTYGSGWGHYRQGAPGQGVWGPRSAADETEDTTNGQDIKNGQSERKNNDPWASSSRRSPNSPLSSPESDLPWSIPPRSRRHSSPEGNNNNSSNNNANIWDSSKPSMAPEKQERQQRRQQPINNNTKTRIVVTWADSPPTNHVRTSHSAPRPSSPVRNPEPKSPTCEEDQPVSKNDFWGVEEDTSRKQIPKKQKEKKKQDVVKSHNNKDRNNNDDDDPWSSGSDPWDAKTESAVRSTRWSDDDAPEKAKKNASNKSGHLPWSGSQVSGSAPGAWPAPLWG